MSGGIHSTAVTAPNGKGATAVAPWTSARRTLALILFGWAAAAGTTGIAYLTLGSEWIPISTGVLLCFVFAILMILLHRAWWLGVLSAVPSLFVLVGAVQYAPEAALEERGVRESVVIVADSAAETGGNNHRFTLRRADGSELKEKLAYDGDTWAPKVGRRLDVLVDPDGEVPMEQADDVDAAGRLGGLVAGVVIWTLMALLAGRRGHVRRRRGLDSTDDLPL
ncbi:hypothetical protein [Streptomyces sp. NPDC046909]|uniref:hypothetical protein n=1 Tax=Streptomyces sp. NPDC046909 TaxID=3155617 RepID=UPI0033E83CE2